MAKVRSLFALSSILLPYFAFCDLPVHCLRHQVVGDWDLHLGEMTTERPSCGHRRPDNEEVQPQTSLLETVVQTKRLMLEEPFYARTQNDADGRWTMIYDEGWEANVEGLSFFAFSKFDLYEENGEKKNSSHCGDTMLGWYSNRDRSQFGCYFAKKVQAVDASFVATPMMKSLSYDVPLSLAEHQSMATRINSYTNWSAKVYDTLLGKSPREINKRAGLKRSQTPTDIGATGLDSFMATSTLRRRESANDRKLRQAEEMYPETFDWRDVQSMNFLEPVMDQGDCGSCYTVATMRMMSNRKKIRQWKETGSPPEKELPFSISFPLYCSEYNQGCDGGYAFLTSKWSEDVGMLPATCATYTTRGQCSVKCDPDSLEKRWRAANHRYVGGFYGGSNEADIMKELHENGPVVASLEPKSDLMYYSGGVYKSTEESLHKEWEKVDHAVLLIGWGKTEQGEKYWTLQNSWGPEWGEDGFFRMARGINDSGIESITVAADVVPDDRPNVLDGFIKSL